MNSRSSMPSRWWKVRIVGIVDSPTPTVPICSDSTRVTSRCSRNWWVSAQAAIQPAVPPPAMTTRLILPSLMLFPPQGLAMPVNGGDGMRCDLSAPATRAPPPQSRLPVEFSDQKRPHPARCGLVQWREHPARGLRQVLARALAGTEHVVLEDLAPGLLLALGPVA